jgi:hypothetical protein
MEWNYEIYDWEMLSIMESLDYWWHLLLGAHQPFEIHTDHRNLTCFKKLQKLNWWQACWLSEIQDYHLTLKHVPSKTNTKADILLRWPDFKKGVEDDNVNESLLKSHLFQQITVEIPKFHDSLKVDLQNIERNVCLNIKNNVPGWKYKMNKIITFQNQYYVPNKNQLRETVIWQNHNHITAGHPRQFKTIKKKLLVA